MALTCSCVALDGWGCWCGARRVHPQIRVRPASATPLTAIHLDERQALAAEHHYG
jgi:hypothetical protein